MVNYKISISNSFLHRKVENYNNEFELINVPLSHAWTSQNTVRFNPIPTGLGHVTLIYGLIPPMAGRNRVK